MNSLKLKVSTAFLFLLFVGFSAFAEPTPSILGWNFDWDDNIMFMSTKIVLYKKGTDEEKPVSTGEYAEVRQKLGQAGTEWADYEVRREEGKSFRYFSDARGKNYFLDDVLETMKKDPSQWRGPSWDAFVEACSRPETAKYVTIITAREHSPTKIRAALKKMQEMGLIKYVPPEKGIIPVGNAKFGASSADPSARKTFFMKQFLDDIQKKIPRGKVEVVTPEGNATAKLHLWGFSDDDYGNFSRAVKDLGEAIKADPKRWSRIKITLFYTGTKKPDVKPHGVVLDHNGDPRPIQVNELGEAKHVLGDRGCDTYYDWLTGLKPVGCFFPSFAPLAESGSLFHFA